LTKFLQYFIVNGLIMAKVEINGLCKFVSLAGGLCEKPDFDSGKISKQGGSNVCPFRPKQGFVNVEIAERSARFQRRSCLGFEEGPIRYINMRIQRANAS